MTRLTVGTAAQPVEIHDVPEHLSYSQLTKLHPFYQYSCARQWAYRYRLRLAEDPSPPLLVGRAFDNAANDFFRARLQGAEPLEAGAKAMDRSMDGLEPSLRTIPELANDDSKITDYLGVFAAGFAAFLNAEGASQPALIQDKHTFTIQWDQDHRMPIVGYSDRVDQDGTLVDHKWSGSPRWDKEGNWDQAWVAERRDQLLLYWLARAAEERRVRQPLTPPLSGRGRLVVTYHKIGLQKPQVRALELELNREAGGQALLIRLAEAARTLYEGRYPARPGGACKYCSFMPRCRDDELARGRPFLELIECPF